VDFTFFELLNVQFLRNVKQMNIAARAQNHGEVVGRRRE
jgi:hypothetical protein